MDEAIAIDMYSWISERNIELPEFSNDTIPGQVAATCVTITPYPNFSNLLTLKIENDKKISNTKYDHTESN